MVFVDEFVLTDPARMSSVEELRRALPALPMPLDAVARLAARLLGAPMAAVSLVGDDEEYLAGCHELPGPAAHRRRPLEYSVAKYVVSADRLVASGDMTGGGDPALAAHPIAVRYGVRAFVGVPLRDGDDRPVGALTVLDTAERDWTVGQAETLLEIAELLHLKSAADAPVRTGAGLDRNALLDSVEEAFLAVNPDGVVVGFNRAAEELFGYHGDEVCGRHLDASLLPDYDGQPVDLALGRLFATKPGHRVVRRLGLRHRNGHRFTATVSMSVVRGAAGAVACLFLTDPDRRSDGEEAPGDRESRYLTALLDSLSVGVVACDATGAVVLMNRAIRKVFCLPPDGPLPVDYASVAARYAHDEDGRPMPWAQDPLQRAWRGEWITDVDVQVQVPGRPMRTFAVTARPIAGVRGRLLGAVSVAHEVSALRRAERFRACRVAVEFALQHAGSAIEAAPGILGAVGRTLGWPAAELWLIDEATGDLESVGRWSTPGLDLSDILGQPIKRGFGITGRVWESGRPIWVPDIGHTPVAPTAEESVRLNACIRHGIRTVLAVPVRDGGTLLGVLTCLAGAPEDDEDLLTVLLEGVGAQIGVYVALRRAEEATRQLTRAKDDFIALVSHEMRTPLTSIVANATMLGEDPGDLDEERRHMVDAVARNAAGLSNVVDTLLDLAGLDSGYLALACHPVDLAAVVADAAETARADATAAGVRLALNRPGRLWLHADAGRLRQVVDDLLTNAIKYSPDGGDVEVELTADDSLAELRVSDAGIGTPADEHDRVFDRFYRGSNVRHHGVPGNGLGLSLARTIVELHGGTIRLGERVPRGTTVLVRIPIREAKP